MKYIKRIILICILICLIIIICLSYLLLDNKNKVKLENNLDNKEINSTSNNNNLYNEDNNQKFINLKNNDDYFKIKKIINIYFSYIKQLNGDIKIENNINQKSNEDVISDFKKDSINYFNNIFDKKYIELFIQDEESILELANEYRKNNSINCYKKGIEYNLVITECYNFTFNKNIQLFLINYLVDNKEEKMIIKCDLLNNTYSFFLDNYIKKYNLNQDINVNNIDILSGEIPINKSNSLIKVNVNDETMSREYLNIQKNYLLNNIEKEYNLLDEEYKKKRFPTKESFNEYVSNNKESLSDIRLAKYSVKDEQNKIIYNLVDNYGRYYIIETHDGVLDYTVKLDDYTILNDEYINLYNKADNNNKVISNTQLFIRMLNNKDYKAIYSHLDNTFKDNNFQSEQSFINYLKKNFYSYNEIISIDEVKNEGSYYIVNFTIKNLVDKSSNELKRTCIIALENGTDFTMALGI